MTEYVSIEREFEDDNGTFWWKQCEKPECANQVCLWASDKYCYPHSAWYRPLMARINRAVTFFQILR